MGFLISTPFLAIHMHLSKRIVISTSYDYQLPVLLTIWLKTTMKWIWNGYLSEKSVESWTIKKYIKAPFLKITLFTKFSEILSYSHSKILEDIVISELWNGSATFNRLPKKFISYQRSKPSKIHQRISISISFWA